MSVGFLWLTAMSRRAAKYPGPPARAGATHAMSSKIDWRSQPRCATRWYPHGGSPDCDALARTGIHLACKRLKRVAVGFTRPDPQRAIDRRHKDLAVADL